MRRTVLADPDFPLEVTGFEMGEIDTIIDGGDVEPKGLVRVLGEEARYRKPDPDDVLPEPEPGKPSITRPGTVWTLGEHRHICGDSTKPETYDELLGLGLDTPDIVELVFTDPPYNVPIEGHVSGLGKHTHREFAMASGEMSASEFRGFLASVFRQCARVSSDGSVHFLCMDWRHMRELMSAAAQVYSALLNLCVWNKDNGGMGSLYRSKHELVFVYRKGEASHINNVKLGSGGRYRTNVWITPG